MKLQEIFDKVGAHLLMQGEASVFLKGEHGGCAYRATSSKGKKLSCAVGSLIDDKHYRWSIESRWCGDLPVKTALYHSGVLENTPETYDDNSPEIILLSMLQRLHDSGEYDKYQNDFRKRMFVGLEEIARKQGLEFNFEESDWIDE